MTKASFQALAYGQELRERQGIDQEKNNFLDVRAPNRSVFRDFIFGEGIFSEDEQVKMHLRVADRIAEHARATFREQFAKEFNDHRANAVVEVPIPQKKNPMPHAWSSDPDRDTRVRMEEDGRTKPCPTLAECLRGEGAVSPVPVSEHLETLQKAQLAAARERDRADEARARYRKRWQERGRTIAKLQARLSERKASGTNSTLAGWCRVVQAQRTEAVYHAAACRKEVFDLRKLVSDYEDRICELNLKVNRLESDLDLAVQSHANATERRLKAEAQVATLLESEAWGVNCKPFADATKSSPPVNKTDDEQRGLATDRIVLEITHREIFPARDWAWSHILRLHADESVRVVDEFGTALPKVVEEMAAEINRLDAELDAAKQRHLRECEKCSALADKVIGLKARVAELESAPAASGNETKEKTDGMAVSPVVDVCDHCDLGVEPSRSAEVAGGLAPAASGAANTDVVGYAVKQGKFYSQHLHANYGDAWGVAGKGTVVPLYAAPQAARGWLTEEEREAVQWAADAAYDKQHPAEDTLRSILARSTPPEVELPELHTRTEVNEAHKTSPCLWLRRPDVLAALAAAGVTVKEVGK